MSANEYIDRTGVQMTRDHLSDEAYYSPTKDCIVIPKLEQFGNEAEYYSTAFHEMVHSAGHKTRLDRFPNRMSAAAFFSTNVTKVYIFTGLFALVGFSDILFTVRETKVSGNRCS